MTLLLNSVSSSDRTGILICAEYQPCVHYVLPNLFVWQSIQVYHCELLNVLTPLKVRRAHALPPTMTSRCWRKVTLAGRFKWCKLIARFRLPKA
jgi:hypothetical protein